ncbi:MAG: hypothetical protein ACJATF_002969 [Flavobacteriales bacterium]|jgi:hypothetical protein
MTVFFLEIKITLHCCIIKFLHNKNICMITSAYTKLLLCLFTIISLFSNIAFAQWSPNTTSTQTSIYRSGSVGVGLSNYPNANLHVFQSITSDGLQYPPTFRLERSYSGNKSTWDFLPEDGLQLYKGNGFSTKLALTIKTTGIEASGNKLELGHGATSDPGDNMTFGYDEQWRGNYILFNGTHGGTTSWQGTTGKAIIHSKGDGSLNFLTQVEGSDLTPSESTRLTITPEGTTIIGDHDPIQYLNIASDKISVLRFDRLGGARDYEILGNFNGDLEFRGGVNGEGDVLPNLMTLKHEGMLAIGTDETPSNLGGVDISDFKLYVEGGILTKEVRVRTLWSDYVFYDDYELLPLEEVENHISEKGHLHNTPSGETVENSGLDVGGMMANQQEKIEEIYLHLIEMNKKVTSLEKENKELKEKVKELEQ